jgi:AcrR family transcriptional regulator
MFANSRSRPSPRRRRAPAQRRARDTVGAVLTAAAHLFETRGYAATTTNHIAIRAGVSIGSLYQYFADKDAILAALGQAHLDEAGRALVAEVARLRAAAPAPAAWARSLVRALVRLNDAPIHGLTYRAAPPPPQLRASLDAVIADVAAEVAAYLRARGQRSAATRARVVVVAAIALVHELVVGAPPAEARAGEREIARMLAGYLG